MNRAVILALSLLLWACTSKENVLPILGEKLVDPVSGKTTHYKAPSFELTNQMNQTISNQQFAGQIQVVDFFFTSCPTICPQMTAHLKLVEEAYANTDEVALISFSIDARNDSPERLFNYAERYEANHEKWSFLTGDTDLIFELAKDYKVRAFDDSSPSMENNLIHDGTFTLIDGNRHIRGYYNGLELKDIDRLIDDIKKLLKE